MPLKLFARTARNCLFGLLILGINALPADAKIGFEYTTNLNSTDNLYSDSSHIYDAYSYVSLKLKAYPLSMLEISANGEQSNYRAEDGLSNQLGGLSFAFAPLPQNSRLAIYVSADMNGRVYHSAFKRFNNNYIDLLGSAGYELSSFMSVRSGASYKHTRYVNSGKTKRDLDLFFGGNITFPGQNSLDLESGFSFTNCPFKDTLGPAPDPEWPYSFWAAMTLPEKQTNIRIFYFSPRLSRPIGAKTGINISFTRQLFQNYDNQWTGGDSTQFLSPWASVWEGSAITAGVKSFIIPHFILTANAGYWDKTYFKTIEDYKSTLAHIIRVDHKDYRRHDWQTRLSFGAQYPIKTRSGFLVEPSINLDYTNTRSNNKLYQFHNLMIAGGVKLRY